MPDQKPHRSNQNVETPDDFFQACVERFGEFTWDLAAEAQSAKTGFFITEEDNSLIQPWHDLDGNLWLNPPYEKIEDWAEKCRLDSRMGATIFMLVPASVGSEWYRNAVAPCAYVFFLSPRLKFVGHKTSYPKDLMLCRYAKDRITGNQNWRWK